MNNKNEINDVVKEVKVITSEDCVHGEDIVSFKQADNESTFLTMATSFEFYHKEMLIEQEGADAADAILNRLYWDEKLEE